MYKKYIKQLFIYLMELIIICIFGLIIFNLLNILSKDIKGIINDVIIIISIYEVAIYLILSMYDDAIKDMYIAYKSFLKKVELYNKDKVFEYKLYLLHIIDSQIEDTLFNSKELINKYIYYKDKLLNNNINEMELKNDLIDIEHNIELIDLKWRLSILLRCLK